MNTITSCKKYDCTVYTFEGEHAYTEAVAHWAKTRKTLKYPADAEHPRLISAKKACYEVRTEISN